MISLLYSLHKPSQSDSHQATHDNNTTNNNTNHASIGVVALNHILVCHDESAGEESVNMTVVTLAMGVVVVACPQIVELVELALRHGLHLLEHGPLDAFRAGWRCEGAIVGPVVLDVDLAEEVVERNFGVHGLRCARLQDSRDLVEEPIVMFTVCVVLVTIFHIVVESIKHESKHGAQAAIHVGVHHVQLAVVMLSVDSVLRWAVNMELSKVKVT